MNQNTNTGGNDFAIDDITFSTFCTNTAEVTVTVNELPEADAGEDQSICIGDVTQLEGSGGVTYTCSPGWVMVTIVLIQMQILISQPHTL